MSDLPDGWEWTTLGEIAEWGSGGTPRAKDPRYYGPGIPWAVIGDLNDGVVNETNGSITEIALRESSAKIAPKGSLLIAMYGSIGKLGIAGRDISLNQAIAFAKFNDEVSEVKYMFWYLRSQREHLLLAGKGAAQKNIGQSVLKSWPIPLPPLAEQRRIVAALEGHLSRLDHAVAMSKSVLARLDDFRDRVLTAAASGNLNPRRSGESAARPDAVGVDDGELPDVPAAWSWRRLGDFAEVVGGVTKDAKKQSDPLCPEVPYLRVANVQRGRLKLDDVAKIRVDPVKAKKLYLEHGDVLLNEGGDRDKLGRGWIWEDQIDPCIHQNHVFRARVQNDVLHPKLLAWHANGFGKQWFFANGKQSVNLASISLSKVKLLPVPVPPREEQEALVEVAERYLSMFDKTEQLLTRILSRAERLRQSLLREAFAGRLVEQDSGDEPASVLLERIRTERESVPKATRERKPRAAKKAGGDGTAARTTLDSGRPLPESVGQGTQDSLDLGL